MKKGKFYIAKHDIEHPEVICVEQVDGYFDTIETSNGNIISIGIYKSGNAYVAVEISTGMQSAISYGNYNLCLVNAKFNADIIYEVINDGSELIAKCKQLINEANEGDIK